ncbi:GNAT family N-acetyltransferase [Neobacillus piezotolerans]|uniref:GNAT family N-acetyltransferase n=1 Tax=Neobacillus piezotolerans TaxID=2259171 RepID=A0A3D8GTF3_9BACI|nr:GNAT family N-acetyltransferase [Neobacillus piezotolerans]RDU37521.1 GNAT family N-acetyltransferase [Neobacillus piezotolerans]
MRDQTEPEAVALEFYNERHRAYLEEYSLPEEQKKFTAMPLEALKACENDSGRHPVVILYDGEPVGFFVLHEGEGIAPYTESPEAILLRGYSINVNCQGLGIASQSLRQISGFVKKNFPDKTDIILAVNNANLAAQHVYRKSGFADRGRRIMGRSGEQYIFHKDIV